MKTKNLLLAALMLFAVTAAFASKFKTKRFSTPASFVYNGMCASGVVTLESCSDNFSGPQCTIFFINGPANLPAFKPNTSTPCTVPLRKPF